MFFKTRVKNDTLTPGRYTLYHSGSFYATEDQQDVSQVLLPQERIVKHSYVDNSGDVTTTIPKESDDYITMEDDEGTKIGMSLPKE